MRFVHLAELAWLVGLVACAPPEAQPVPVVVPIDGRPPQRAASPPGPGSAAPEREPPPLARERPMPFVDVSGYLDHPYRDVLVEEIGRVLGLVCDGWTNGADVRLDGDEIAELVWYDGVSEQGTPLAQHVGKKVSRPPPEIAEFFRGQVRVGLCVSYVQNPALAQ